MLAYFLYLAFGKWNKKNLWVKGGKCFLINGKAPHIACFKSGYSSIKRLGWMDRFDTRLKAICEEFNHIEETAKEKVENKGRIIHIGKEVFYSDKSEEKKQAVFSGLINGGYISPTTSIDIFMGIFDETVFTRPVLWIKSQVSLMYFVYLSFRADNDRLNEWYDFGAAGSGNEGYKGGAATTPCAAVVPPFPDDRCRHRKDILQGSAL